MGNNFNNNNNKKIFVNSQETKTILRVVYQEIKTTTKKKNCKIIQSKIEIFFLVRTIKKKKKIEWERDKENHIISNDGLLFYSWLFVCLGMMHLTSHHTIHTHTRKHLFIHLTIEMMPKKLFFFAYNISTLFSLSRNNNNSKKTKHLLFLMDFCQKKMKKKKENRFLNKIRVKPFGKFIQKNKNTAVNKWF